MALDLVSIAQPHYIPGYTGHCPEYKYRIGDTYGSTTHKILLDPAVQHSERLVLSDRTADDFQIYRPSQTDIDVVNARFRNGDPVYKHPMIPGYEGFLPKLNAHFGQRYTVAATEALSEFQKVQLNQRSARNQLERVVDLQAGKGQPWDLVDRFSATAEFKLPLVTVRPECAGILRDVPMDEPKLSPASHSVSPYFMEDSDPEKYIKKGFAGHVPYGFQRFGESSKKLTNSALCDFSSNYRRRQSTEWAPVNVVKFIFGLRKFDHVSQFRTKLKWLPIRLRRNTHILSLLYNILFNPTSPVYLKKRFTFLHDTHSRYLRSSENLRLAMAVHSTRYFNKSFTIEAARLWNTLPKPVRSAQSITSFKRLDIEHYMSLQTN